MQVSSIARVTAAFDPVWRTATRAVAAQVSAQSRQVRTHWRMSICSAESASAQAVQIVAQNMACRTASASGSFGAPPSGWASMIFWIDMPVSFGPRTAGTGRGFRAFGLSQSATCSRFALRSTWISAWTLLPSS